MREKDMREKRKRERRGEGREGAKVRKCESDRVVSEKRGKVECFCLCSWERARGLQIEPEMEPDFFHCYWKAAPRSTA